MHPPFKSLPSLPGVIAGVVLGFFPCASVRAEETAVWLAGDARTSSAGILLPDSKGSFGMEVKDSTGITIGDKPSVGADTKSLEFSGTQVSAFRTIRPFPPVEGKLKIELDAMILPDSSTGSVDSTLLRHSTQWEIRYLGKSKTCVFIVWHDKNVFTEVRVPVKVGEWTTISAEYTAEEMKLRVGEDSAKVVPKDVLGIADGPAALLMGACTTKVEGEPLPRLFSGSLANIRISLE